MSHITSVILCWLKQVIRTIGFKGKKAHILTTGSNVTLESGMTSRWQECEATFSTYKSLPLWPQMIHILPSHKICSVPSYDLPKSYPTTETSSKSRMSWFISCLQTDKTMQLWLFLFQGPIDWNTSSETLSTTYKTHKSEKDRITSIDTLRKKNQTTGGTGQSLVRSSSEVQSGTYSTS